MHFARKTCKDSWKMTAKRQLLSAYLRKAEVAEKNTANRCRFLLFLMDDE